MRINIKTLGGNSRTELEKEVSLMSEPVVLLDENLKVVSKSPAVNEYIPGIRRGAKFSRFLSGEALSVVSSMNAGGVSSIELEVNSATLGGMAVCGDRFTVVFIRPLYAKLIDLVTADYKRMSGYDNEIPALMPKESRVYEIAGLLSELLDTMDFFNGLPFFNSASVIRGIAQETAKLPKKLSERFEFSVSENELITDGSDRAFALISLFAASFFAENGAKKVKTELSGKGNEIVLRVVGEDLVLFSGAEIFKKPFRAPEDMNETDFWLYMIKLLADRNLWDFEIERGVSGKTAFVLRSNFVRKGEEFALRDISSEFIEKVISIILH